MAMKQRVRAIQTESCDEAINRLTNRDPTLRFKGLIFLRMPQEGADLLNLQALKGKDSRTTQALLH